MKVILLQDVEKLGKKYDLKEVKDGYARNFLLPGKLARPATEEALKKSQELASKLDGLELSIAIKIGEEGQLFESITSQKILEKLKEMGFEVKKSQISLEKPIKELGEFPVKINLDHNLEIEIKLIVTEEK